VEDPYSNEGKDPVFDDGSMPDWFVIESAYASMEDGGE
jgi:hypothetical protein